MLIGEVYSYQLRALKKWYVTILFHIFKKNIINKIRGDTFRRLLLRIGEIRSLLPSHVNIMALTATATKTLRRDIARIIGMRNELIVARPVKSNVNNGR